MQQLVFIQENKPVTNSRLVAEAFEKEHKHVMRDIYNLECSPEFYQSNFGLIQINSDLGKGRSRMDRAFNITKDGFVFLAMGYTGAKAAKFKESYIKAFNDMESSLQTNAAIIENNRLCEIEKKVLSLTKNLEQAGLFKFLENLSEVEKSKNVTIAIPSMSVGVRKLYSVREYIDASKKIIPSGYTTTVSLKAIQWSKRNGVQYSRSYHGNKYAAEAIEFGINRCEEMIAKHKARDIDFLRTNKTAQDLKLLEVGEYLIFHQDANQGISSVVSIINKWTTLGFKVQYRKTLNPSIKVTRTK